MTNKRSNAELIADLLEYAEKEQKSTQQRLRMMEQSGDYLDSSAYNSSKCMEYWYSAKIHTLKQLQEKGTDLK